MNIFHLSRDVEKCARYHCDKHVVKMILEHVQMLSTANRVSGLDEGYKVAHLNHPCTIWTRHSLDNWLHLKELTVELNKEWRYRYGHSHNHKSFEVMMGLSTPKLPKLGVTIPPKCMPDDVKLPGVIESYRNYYRVHKLDIATYTNRSVPNFLKQLTMNS